MIAVIIKYFRAWTTGAGWTHHPEIVISCDSDYLIIGKTTNFFPKRHGLIIVVIDSHHQFFFWNAQLFCDHFPSKKYSLFFEVITKAKVTHHLKECVVACGVAHVIKIIMLAAGAHAFLSRGRASVIASFNTGKEVFKLHHPRVGKHQCRIIARHKRTREQDTVSLFVKIIQKGGADII